MKNKNLILMIKLKLITALSVLFFPSALLAENIKYPFLALDAINEQKLPKNFRTTNNPLPFNKVSLKGLRDLKEIGSGQFSEGMLKEVLKKFHRGTSIIDIDLRQETHGFINGNVVSIYGQYDWANRGKSDTRIQQEEKKFAQTLKNTPQITAFYRDKKNALKLVPYTFPIANVSSEENLVKKYRLGYQRIYVTDHCKPTDTQVDQFIKIVKQLPPQTWLYFHCRAGVGRTTTFMVLYDMMRNAKHVSFNDILKRQALLGGKDLIALPKAQKNPIFYDCYKKRLDFLRSFYLYAKDNQDDYSTSWTQWIQK